MDKVWIVTTKLDGAVEPFIEGIFDSYKLAYTAAEDAWRRCEPFVENSYLWKRGEVNTKDFCKMTIWYTNKKTWKENYFMTIKIESYPVRH